MSLLFFLLTTTALSAQSPNKELGIRFTGLNSYSLLYKKELRPEVYRRYNLAASDLTVLSTDDQTAINFNASVGIGKETRRPMGERLVFAHGWQPSLGIGFSNVNDLSLVTITPGVGYLLGFHYQVSQRFYFGVEAIPSLGLGVALGDATVLNFRAGLSSTGVGLTGVYRFSGLTISN